MVTREQAKQHDLLRTRVEELEEKVSRLTTELDEANNEIYLITKTLVRVLKIMDEIPTDMLIAGQPDQPLSKALAETDFEK
jgi:hypothetical protein